jgi:hypothetical protein
MGSLSKQMFKAVSGKGGLVGVGAGLGLSFLRYCMLRPGVQAYMDHLLGTVFPSLEKGSPPPGGVVKTAKAITDLFRERGFSPARLGIDGPPGSGKSSLAGAMAETLGMEAVCLDHQDLDRPSDFTGTGVIYEHHRLLRTQAIDSFDAIIYIDEPVIASKKRVLSRKRGGYLVEILDYHLLKRIGDKAFSCADGDTVAVGAHLVKFRPREGYRDMDNIHRELCSAGLDATGASKEECLFLCLEGVRRAGFKAYLDLHAFDGEMVRALAESAFLSGRTKTRWR